MTQRMRCAIYTRKSSEEGLEQSFNSLDAQREACEAYIKSQQHEGWQAISMHFDDGGFSGGNMDRPSLKQLMAEIHAGKVNVVVVYKVDRLTRSLADFAKIIEQFDQCQVSFVSVTQQFNTTSSMGRLTLNVLLSFAQFEREVTGERIRDKIAASKKKGMWMGGTTPIGYTAQDHKLIVNESEAATVKTIFSEFLRLGNVTSLQAWLRDNNIRSRGGNHFYRGPLYEMLRNPHYLGLIRHKKDTYPGEHEAIIDRQTWDKAQVLLDESRQGNRRKPRATKASLFTGILFDAEGMMYTPTHAAKNGRRYRYYTAQAVIRKAQKTAVPARIPAPDLESAVVDRILDLFRNPEDLLAALRGDSPNAPQSIPNGFFTKVLAQAAAAAATWDLHLFPEHEQFLKTILDRVIVHATHVEIRIRVSQLIEQLLGEGHSANDPGRIAGNQVPTLLQQIASIECPFRHIPQGRALRLIVGNAQITPDASHKAILKAIARARSWYEQIVSGEVSCLSDVAQLQNLNYSYAKKIFPLALLSPANVEEILNPSRNLDMTLDSLLGNNSIIWATQTRYNH